MNGIANGLEADRSLSDIRMSILACAAFIFAVIDMNDCRVLLSNQFIKPFNDTVEVIIHIISGVI